MKPCEKVTINPVLIPKSELRVFCAAILDAVLKFYEDPKNNEEFEK